MSLYMVNGNRFALICDTPLLHYLRSTMHSHTDRGAGVFSVFPNEEGISPKLSVVLMVEFSHF